MTAILDLSGVNKVYNAETPHAVHAVRDLDLAVEQGEIVALLGSSGCGKTSTLRMIAGFEGVTRGGIRLAGEEIHTRPPARRGVAMAFEGYSLYPPLTVRENIAFAMKSEKIGRDEIDARVTEIARLLEIEKVLDRYPSSISGGQQQRAGLGRALVRKADLYLLDEPMGQLEPQLRALLRGRIKHFIKERGLTAILVTHDQTEANALADRIAVMEGGVLQQYDTPERLKDRPANIYTGTFIGEPPMNVFDAAPQADEGRLVFRLGDGTSLSYGEDRFAPDLRRAILDRGKVVLGIRPHAVGLGEDGDESAMAEVTAAQWLGDQTHIAARFAGGLIVSVRHDRVRLSQGDTIRVSLGAEALHLFDPESGEALGNARDAA